ncbi:MAG: hypothetical protein KC464_20310, partial [Myxococcales bacterium]|nr:hypothetical protein [Myxococcales bacterium]
MSPTAVAQIASSERIGTTVDHVRGLARTMYLMTALRVPAGSMRAVALALGAAVAAVGAAACDRGERAGTR